MSAVCALTALTTDHITLLKPEVSHRNCIQSGYFPLDYLCDWPLKCKGRESTSAVLSYFAIP